MILTVHRNPEDKITDLYGQPVLLHDVLIVGALRFIVPPITDDATLTADIALCPDLPQDIINLCHTKPLHVRKIDKPRQFTRDWYRYRFQLAASPENSIRLAYAGEEGSHGVD